MLVDACLHGDRSAFDELVDRYEGPLYNAAFRITGSVDDAMDATQTAFVKAFEKLHTYDPKYRFFSWIYRIVVNQSLNIVGRRREEPDLVDELPARDGDPEAVLDSSERIGQLEKTLLELRPEHRTMILLKHLEGFSYHEIGELLDIPEKTVKSRLFSARRQLRVLLKQRGVTP